MSFRVLISFVSSRKQPISRTFGFTGNREIQQFLSPKANNFFFEWNSIFIYWLTSKWALRIDVETTKKTQIIVILQAKDLQVTLLIYKFNEMSAYANWSCVALFYSCNYRRILILLANIWRTIEKCFSSSSIVANSWLFLCSPSQTFARPSACLSKPPSTPTRPRKRGRPRPSTASSSGSSSWPSSSWAPSSGKTSADLELKGILIFNYVSYHYITSVASVHEKSEFCTIFNTVACLRLFVIGDASVAFRQVLF